MSRVELSVRPWRHELAGCLHGAVASMLDHHGVEPDTALGAGWRFRYSRGDVRPEEYYYPCAGGESLVEAVAPHSGIASTWHRPLDSYTGWAEVRAELLAGHPAVVAVDNFHLPFRPAYHDVHANHLALVTGFDDEARTAAVTDPVPPAFAGDLPLVDLGNARDSGNPVHHDRDLFFTNAPITNRWFSTRMVARPMGWDQATVRGIIAEEVQSLQNPSGGFHFTGLNGAAAFLADGADRLADEDGVADEVFVVAGTALADAAIHADWLRRAGRDFGRRDLAEAARSVDQVAHHWTAVRILAGSRTKDHTTGDRLRHRSERLVRSWAEALSVLDRTSQE